MIRFAQLALAAALAGAAPAMALGPVAFGPDLAAQGWETLTFRGRTPIDFRAEGAGTLDIHSEQGVSVVYRTLPPSFAPARGATWRWQVEAGVPPTDLSQRGGDDRAIAVYFLFADDPAAAADPPTSLRAALRRGRALIYVWGGDAARRTVIESPQIGNRGQMVIQRGAEPPTDAWVPENVDLRADFRTAFGRDAGPLVAVAVSSDSDDTGRVVDARLSDLVLR